MRLLPAIQTAQRRRRPRDYRFPFPPFPLGWYSLGEAAAFRAGGVHTLHRFGRDLVVFRTDGGELAVVDPFCPHLGAHLGTGCVRGDTLVCPFHGFSFGVDGRCTSLPSGYTGRIPPQLACRTWPSRTVSGMLFVWFDPAGGAPRWELPEPDPVGFRALRTQRWSVRTHPQETGEGSVDLGHLRAVHGYLTAEPLRSIETDGPRLRVGYRATRRAMPGMPRETFSFDFAPQLHGLGFSLVEISLVEIDLRYRVWVLATPIDPEIVDYRVALSMQVPESPGSLHPALGYLPRQIAVPLIEHLTFREFAGDVELDFRIWENKAYVPRPALVAGDGPIGIYRRWARQFYPHDGAPHDEDVS